MANLCSNLVEITGDAEAIKTLMSKIAAVHAISDRNKLTEDNWYLCDADTLHCDYGMHNLQQNSDTEVTFNICSRNAPPEKNLLELSKEILTLEITCLYEEPACECYGSLQYTEGSCIEDTCYTTEEWLDLYDEDYKAEKKRIQELPYEEFLEEYSSWNDEGELDEEAKYSYLSKIIVARIKDDDLPLFINVEWHDDDSEAQYKARYKP